MRKSVIEPASIFRKELFSIPEKVTRFQKKEHNITDEWIAWLTHLEDLFTKYHYTEAAEVAGHRAQVIAAAAFEEGKRVKKRKLMTTAAINTVQPVQQLLTDVSNKLEEKIEVVRNLIKQILVPAKDAGMINYEPGHDFTAYLEKLLAQFKTHEQLAPSVNSAIASIGKYDVLKILAEEIEF
ncbi:hypothetical protein LY01_01572 [Nonlabens xylanidelens]|uniref:Uncharacterized protein n=1 Tax=Nonlabens xylanidelens TaxID=191564 RepID=A0A2S6IKT2_9FLAO|nr:hypothetical protein [Nonlabens xylanidelens]PPK94819.1 hypothetical protein LY01_01572 [Nonlabens xylanidelens]PQJ17376.1 hypothetical protein BST94_09945 [Nonlabens xylanidelens]